MKDYINRITVEFKLPCGGICKKHLDILIESQWNLNYKAYTAEVVDLAILIESQWNLNIHAQPNELSEDFNINRITVEFKLRFSM